MKYKFVFIAIATLLAITSFAQKNFTWSPEYPKAGDIITITYEAAGVLGGNMKFVDAAYYTKGGKEETDDIKLTRNGRKFTGTVQTDTSNSFVCVGFSIDNQF